MDRTTKVLDDLSVREVYSNRIVAASYDGAVLSVTLAFLRDGITYPEQDALAVVNNRFCIPEVCGFGTPQRPGRRNRENGSA